MPKDRSTLAPAAGLQGSIAATRTLARPVRRSSVVGIPSKLRYGFTPSSYMPRLSTAEGGGPARDRGKSESLMPESAPPRLQTSSHAGQPGILQPKVEVDEVALLQPKVEVDEVALLHRSPVVVEAPVDPVVACREVEGEIGAAEALGALDERFRLEHAVETIDALNTRLAKMEQAEQRLKKNLKAERERLKNSKAEAEGALSLLVLAEEKISQAEGQLSTLRNDVNRYRSWWLTEYYSLKAMLTLVPREHRADVHHIVHSAHARFETFSNRNH